MTIRDYYVNSQSSILWYNKFQSTSNSQSGKTFNYTNTNFRKLLSFAVQFNEFRAKLGKDRKDWKDKLPCGQERDKHRITNLINAGLIKQEDEYFFITPKGLVLSDLIDSNLSDSEKWLIIFLLILDYNTPDRKLDVVWTIKLMYSIFEDYGYSLDWVNEKLLKILKEKDKLKLFRQDIFWVITFYKDPEFLRILSNNSNAEKEELYDYVIRCSENIKSNDLIAKKYRPSGVYSGTMFNEDVNVIYYANIVLGSIYDNFDAFINNIIKQYAKTYPSINRLKIENFICNHKSVFIKIKQDILGGIN